jgi:hypothetical protein
MNSPSKFNQKMAKRRTQARKIKKTPSKQPKDATAINRKRKAEDGENRAYRKKEHRQKNLR